MWVPASAEIGCSYKNSCPLCTEYPKAPTVNSSDTQATVRVLLSTSWWLTGCHLVCSQSYRWLANSNAIFHPAKHFRWEAFPGWKSMTKNNWFQSQVNINPQKGQVIILAINLVFIDYWSCSYIFCSGHIWLADLENKTRRAGVLKHGHVLINNAHMYQCYCNFDWILENERLFDFMVTRPLFVGHGVELGAIVAPRWFHVIDLNTEKLIYSTTPTSITISLSFRIL